MHSSYQAISPEIALEILIKHLPKNHKCINWLVEGEFDENLLKKIPANRNASSQKLRKKYKSKYANSTSNLPFEYWVEGKRAVNPYHSILQAKFVSYLRKNKIIPLEDKDFIDVQYEENGVLYFSELKPTNNIKTKYAIRSAIGQILEYSYKSNKKAKLEIVVGSKPKKEEIEFVKSLGISISYWNGKSFVKNRAS